MTLIKQYPGIPLADSTDNINSADVGGNKEDAAAVAVNTTQSQMAYLKGAFGIILTLTTEDYIMSIHVPSVIDVDNTMLPQVTFYDKKLKIPVASGDIVAGTFKLARYRANTRTEILGATAWTVTTGKIKDSRQAASASWATDDLAVWEPQGDTTIEVNGSVVTPIIPELQIPIGDISTLETKLDNIIGDITSAVDEPPTAKSLQDILHKDTNYTFDNETDSLEAISDSVSTGSLELEADAGSTAINIVDAAALTQATTNWFRNAMVVAMDGDNAGQARRIIAFTTATDSIDVYPAFLAAPTAGDKFLIISTWQPNVLDQQADVAVTLNATTSAANIFDLNTAGLTYHINNLILKSVDPGADTITVKLYELVNDASVLVDSFDITTSNYTNYFKLYDMFSVHQLVGDDIQITIESDANSYAITGQYQYSETYTG